MLSNVQKFYATKNVFITGGTGFLGQILVEKLLRCCPEVENIFLLMRTKNGCDVTTRKKEYFNDAVFEQLKNHNPAVLDKIHCVQGDMELPNLGLSKYDRDLLASNINVVFHSAATVIFDEKLSKAVRINLSGTKGVLDLCKEIKPLKALVHVSTAFTNAHRVDIDEKVYPSHNIMPWNDLLMYDFLDRDETEIKRNWPNTYTLTKFSSEIMLSQTKGDIPLSIIRPAAVSGCAFAPHQGWIGNHHGVNRVLLDIFTNKSINICLPAGKVALITPVDMCVNNMILSAWEMNENSDSNELKIYNNFPLNNDITWGDLFWKFALKASQEFFEKDIRGILLSTNDKMFRFFHPEYNFYHTVKFVGEKEWNFTGKNLLSLWNRMSDEDRKMFPVNYDSINWEKYIDDCYNGVKEFVAENESRNQKKKRTAN